MTSLSMVNWSRTWCPSMEPHVCCPKIWFSIQPTKNTCKGPSCQFLQLSLWCWWHKPRPGEGQCHTCHTSANKCHQTPGVLRHGNVPQSHHPCACPPWLPLCMSCSRRTQTSPGTAPMMLLFSVSRMLSSVTLPSGTLTLHCQWPSKLMPPK